MNAQQLKNSILQEAIEGHLVSQDPNDEPASVLLDKIRKEKARLVKEGKLKKKDLEETPISEDEKPFKAPNGWEWKRLSDLALDSADGPFGSNLKREHYTNDKEVRIIQLSNIGEDGWIDRNTKYTTFEHLKVISRSEAFSGDIIIAKMMPAGRAIICPSNDVKYVLSSDAVRFDFYKEIERKFLYYAINSKVFLNQVYSGVQGITRVRTSLSKLRTYVLPLPPLAEQKRIVAKIEELLPKVEEYGKAQDALNKLNEELPEKLKKSVLQEAIEGRLVPQDPNDEPASVLLERIREEKKRLVKEGKLKKKDLEETPISEDEKPFEIPESWEWVRLGSLISYQNGYAYNSSEMNKEGKGVPVIKSGNLMTLEVVIKPNNDYIEYPTEKMLSSKIVKGDMLMCLSSQSDNPEPLGKTAIFKLDSYALLNQRVLKIRPYKDELTPYLYYTINSFYFWFNVSHQGGGSAQANLKLNHVLDMPIPLPPLAEQKRIVAKIEEAFNAIDALS